MKAVFVHRITLDSVFRYVQATRKKKPKQTKIKPHESKLNSCQTYSNQLRNSVERIYSLEANSLPSSQENPRVLSNH
jgi:hypothetical protein